MTQKESVKEIGKTEQKKSSSFVKIMALVLVPINLFISLTVLKLAPIYTQFLTPFIKQTIQIDNLEGKINIVIIAAFYFSIFYLAMIMTTINFRVLLGKTTPDAESDPNIIVACQKVLTNSLEQFLLFLPNFALFVFNSAQSGDKNTLIAWIAVFIFSRVLFAFGYIFGAAIRFSVLRQTGFMIGLFLNGFLMIHNLGIYNTLPLMS